MGQLPEITEHGTREAPFVEHRIACGVVRLSPTARYALSEPTGGTEAVRVVIDRGLLWAAVGPVGSEPALEVRYNDATIEVSSGRMLLDAGADGDALVVVVEGALDVATPSGGRHHLPASAAGELTAEGGLQDVPGIGWADFLADPWANANLQRDEVTAPSRPPAEDRAATLADALPLHGGSPPAGDPPRWDGPPAAGEVPSQISRPVDDARWAASEHVPEAPPEPVDASFAAAPVEQSFAASGVDPATGWGDGPAPPDADVDMATPAPPGPLTAAPEPAEPTGALRRKLFIGLAVLLAVLAITLMGLALRARSADGALPAGPPAVPGAPATPAGSG